jgi:hypothetical protein
MRYTEDLVDQLEEKEKRKRYLDNLNNPDDEEEHICPICAEAYNDVGLSLLTTSAPAKTDISSPSRFPGSSARMRSLDLSLVLQELALSICDLPSLQGKGRRSLMAKRQGILQKLDSFSSHNSCFNRSHTLSCIHSTVAKGRKTPNERVKKERTTTKIKVSTTVTRRNWSRIKIYMLSRSQLPLSLNFLNPRLTKSTR